MDWLPQAIKSIEPIQYVYGIVAICGGVARYLGGFANGRPFSFRVFLASTFMSGFSGWMFAIMGMSMNLPQPLVFIMAGTGGFLASKQ